MRELERCRHSKKEIKTKMKRKRRKETTKEKKA
jgi:hypothetical protein